MKKMSGYYKWKKHLDRELKYGTALPLKPRVVLKRKISLKINTVKS